MIDLGEDITASGDNPANGDVLAFVGGELPPDEEEKDHIEVEEGPPACPTSCDVDKAIKTLQ